MTAPREVRTVSILLVVAIVGPLLAAMFSWILASVYIPSKMAESLAKQLEDRIKLERENHNLVHQQIRAQIELLDAETREIESRFNAFVERNK